MNEGERQEPKAVTSEAIRKGLSEVDDYICSRDEYGLIRIMADTEMPSEVREAARIGRLQLLGEQKSTIGASGISERFNLDIPKPKPGSFLERRFEGAGRTEQTRLPGQKVRRIA